MQRLMMKGTDGMLVLFSVVNPLRVIILKALYLYILTH